MNERIKELADQALKECDAAKERGIDQYSKRFAELIVRECLKFVEPDQTSGDEWCVTLDETAQSIKQHFGVDK
jgi:hypothetical protein